jgi:hypothetical protein
MKNKSEELCVDFLENTFSKISKFTTFESRFEIWDGIQISEIDLICFNVRSEAEQELNYFTFNGNYMAG